MAKEYGILSGKKIIEAVKNKDIIIDPFNLEMVNSASYDLTLGNQVAVYNSVVKADFSCDSFDISKGRCGIPGERIHANPHHLDSAMLNRVTRHEMDDRGLMLIPGIGYLMHTAERIRTDIYEPIIDGKSSIGRLFCFCHVSAGFGDPGFDGQYTLEVVVIHPLIVYPGMKFCQMRFHTITGEIECYHGNYTGEFSSGPVPSRSYKQFPNLKDSTYDNEIK